MFQNQHQGAARVYRSGWGRNGRKCCLTRGWLERQAQYEGTARSQLAHRTDLPAMHLSKVFCQCQPEAGSGLPLPDAGIQLLKFLEQASQVLLGDSDAAVADGDVDPRLR